MKYYMYRGKEANFGDELNAYLLPRLLPNFFDEASDPLFLGIGSILNDMHPPGIRKIVFGSGYGGPGYRPMPVVDDSWIVYSVRGPRTAAALGLEAQKVAADLAVMMNLYRTPAPRKRYKFSFMPHFESLARSDWYAVAEAAGIHFIDPRHSVQHVIDELEASEVVIAEAMHGAIVADALRVPWIALEPNSPMHRFKWYDWSEALDIKLRPQQLVPASFYEYVMTTKFRNRWIRRVVKRFGVPMSKMRMLQYTDQAAAALTAAAKTDPSLSLDQRLDTVVSRLQDDLVKLRRDFPA